VNRTADIDVSLSKSIERRRTLKKWRAVLVSILWTKLTLQNWRAKVISLLLAIMVWYLIKKNVETTSPGSEKLTRIPITQTGGRGGP
jgi:hypothetical protein